MLSYHFRFQDVKGRGSPRRYWHYLWGYLLPSLSFLAKKGLIQGKAGPIVFDSFGPVMDRVLGEYMSLLSLEYRLADSSEDVAAAAVKRTVPRWDLLQRSMAWVYLRELPISPPISGRQRWRTGMKILRQEKTIALRSAVASRRLMTDLAVLQDAIREALPQRQCDESSAEPYLILDRSPPPAAYAVHDSRIAREYGTATRSLRGVGETIERLRGLGCPVERFEPGAASQAEQIVRFMQARGVIAIRGAELANMHWLKPGSRLIILRPQVKLSTHLYGMARLLKLEFQELACDNPYPDLTLFAIERYIGTP
ncbi:MAG: glycosyltransferase 61 family protein [Wenzhouxiangella sp.]|jgi:hypothetical protein|nr:glycosyltransferase 61 family protein [Wenzhouxiangella sp.]